MPLLQELQKLMRNLRKSAKDGLANMDWNTMNEFRSILKRMYSPKNSEKYRLICTKTCNEDEDRIWKICEAFWHPEYQYRTSDIEKYVPNPNLEYVTAKRYIKELNQLLDKLGWQ